MQRDYGLPEDADEDDVLCNTLDAEIHQKIADPKHETRIAKSVFESFFSERIVKTKREVRIIAGKGKNIKEAFYNALANDEDEYGIDGGWNAIQRVFQTKKRIGKWMFKVEFE